MKMEFGRKYRIGRFVVLKYNRVLRRSEVAELRNQMGIPMDERKKLQRAQLPYIKVYAMSGIWAVEFCCNTSMYRLIEQWIAGSRDEDLTSLAHMFNMMITDTMVTGDAEFLADKAKAMKALMERQKAAAVSDEEDKAVLDELEADENAKAAIVDMAGRIREGGGS